MPFTPFIAFETSVEPLHYWVTTIGGWDFGIVEFDWGPIWVGPPTTILLGPKSFETSLSAWAVVTIAAAGLVVAFIVLGLVTSKFTAKPEPKVG